VIFSERDPRPREFREREREREKTEYHSRDPKLIANDFFQLIKKEVDFAPYMIIGSIKFTLDIVHRLEAAIVSSNFWRQKRPIPNGLFNFAYFPCCTHHVKYI